MNYERLQLLVDLHKILSRDYVENQHRLREIENLIAEQVPPSVDFHVAEAIKSDRAFHERNAAGWIKLSDRLPPEDVVVETKIDDASGWRNQSHLKRHAGLWFTPDGAMYVYYQPTHWRP